VAYLNQRKYEISYDLYRPGQQYPQLIEHLKKIGAWKPLLSTWLIKTSLTAEQIRDGMPPFIDRNDKVLVAEIGGAGGWASYNLNEQQVAWLRAA